MEPLTPDERAALRKRFLGHQEAGHDYAYIRPEMVLRLLEERDRLQQGLDSTLGTYFHPCDVAEREEAAEARGYAAGELVACECAPEDACRFARERDVARRWSRRWKSALRAERWAARTLQGVLQAVTGQRDGLRQQRERARRWAARWKGAARRLWQRCRRRDEYGRFFALEVGRTEAVLNNAGVKRFDLHGPGDPRNRAYNQDERAAFLAQERDTLRAFVGRCVAEVRLCHEALASLGYPVEPQEDGAALLREWEGMAPAQAGSGQAPAEEPPC